MSADETTDDIYANTGDIFLRVNGNYFHRIVGKGWIRDTPEAVVNITKWSPLHDLQRAAYFPALKEQGLI